MPGYGFATRSGSEIMEWSQMIEIYLMTRQNLGGLLLVMDIRRDWTRDEELLKGFSDMRGFPIAVVLTKADKLTRNEKLKSVNNIRKKAKLDAVFPVSTLNKEGQDEVEQYVFDNGVKE